MDIFQRSLLVFLGSGVGGTVRFWLGSWIAHRTGPAFPWNTMIINTTGSFLIGLLMGYLITGQAPVAWRYLLVVGFLGGYTTFSTFSFETANLLRERSYTYVVANICGSVVLGLLAAVIGLLISHSGSRG